MYCLLPIYACLRIKPSCLAMYNSCYHQSYNEFLFSSSGSIPNQCLCLLPLCNLLPIRILSSSPVSFSPSIFVIHIYYTSLAFVSNNEENTKHCVISVTFGSEHFFSISCRPSI
ncbi:hypothetical protein HS088_TW21G01437 [Tripterygium wilfordii]|uniref:Uncharacterized protein n=1 Tax=Tripterygium wilfordii TaxID=458696 RepID=A0A7J7C576_TRIWF|nr:hypothetical protein HS088_TW21G01437 [Tripterygium wilfordii]